jgi:S-disulfanyl-L-cysteine oxidoreductase SoxD
VRLGDESAPKRADGACEQPVRSQRRAGSSSTHEIAASDFTLQPASALALFFRRGNRFIIRVMRSRWFIASVFALYVAATTAAILQARQAPGAMSVWDGVFTAQQAARGQTQFMAHCAECHMANLSGGEGPALVGDRFWTTWQESTVAALFDRISKNMPFDDDGRLAGSLPKQTYIDVVAHILNSNGFPAGQAELTETSAVGVQIVRREGPTDLAAGTLVQIVGCLQQAGSGWRVVKATRPARSGAVTSAAAKTVPLGEKEFALKFVLTPLTRYIGHRVIASGTLLGTGGADGINVDLVNSVATTCE